MFWSSAQSEVARPRGPRLRLCWALVMLAAADLTAGCAAGPKYDGTLFQGEDVSFRIGPPPQGWRRLESDEALIAFRDDASQATIAVNGRCGKDGDDVPLQALTHHLFLQFTDRDLIEQSEVEIDGRAALETELVARLDGVPKHFLVYVLKKDWCVYDFLRIADVSSEPSGQQEFRRFVGSFRTVDHER